MKKIISNIIFSIVICLCGYLAIANILHIIYLNKHDTFDFNNKAMTTLKQDISTLELNVQKISKLDTSVFSEEDLEIIKSNFDTVIKNINDSKLLSYRGKQKIYLKDLLEIDLTTQLGVSGNIQMLRTLAKYDDSINDYIEVYTYDFLNNGYNGEATFLEPILSYKYNSTDPLYANTVEPINYRTLARIYGLTYYTVKQNYFAKLVLEISGDNNE